MASSSSTDGEDFEVVFSSFANVFTTVASAFICENNKVVPFSAYVDTNKVCPRIVESITDEVYDGKKIDMQAIVILAMTAYRSDISVAEPDKLKRRLYDLADLSTESDFVKLRKMVGAYSNIIMLAFLSETTKSTGLDCSLRVLAGMIDGTVINHSGKMTFFSSILSSQVAYDIFQVQRSSREIMNTVTVNGEDHQMLNEKKTSAVLAKDTHAHENDPYTTPEKKVTNLPVRTNVPSSVGKGEEAMKKKATSDGGGSVVSHLVYEVAAHYLSFLEDKTKYPMSYARQVLFNKMRSRTNSNPSMKIYLEERIGDFFSNGKLIVSLETAMECLCQELGDQSSMSSCDYDTAMKNFTQTLETKLPFNNRKKLWSFLSAYVSFTFIEFARTPRYGHSVQTNFSFFRASKLFPINFSRSQAATGRFQDFSAAIEGSFMNNLTNPDSELYFEVPDISNIEDEPVTGVEDNDDSDDESKPLAQGSRTKTSDTTAATVDPTTPVLDVARLYLNFIKESKDFKMEAIGMMFLQNLTKKGNSMTHDEASRNISTQIKKFFARQHFTIVWDRVVSFLAGKYNCASRNEKTYEESASYIESLPVCVPQVQKPEEVFNAMDCYFVRSFLAFGKSLNDVDSTSGALNSILESLGNDCDSIGMFINAIGDVFMNNLAHPSRESSYNVRTVNSQETVQTTQTTTASYPQETVDSEDFFEFSNHRRYGGDKVSHAAYTFAEEYLDIVSKSSYPPPKLGKDLFEHLHKTQNMTRQDFDKFIRMCLGCVFDDNNLYYYLIDAIDSMPASVVGNRKTMDQVTEDTKHPPYGLDLDGVTDLQSAIDFIMSYITDHVIDNRNNTSLLFDWNTIFTTPNQDLTDRQADRYKDFVQAINGSFRHNIILFDQEPKYLVPKYAHKEDDILTEDEEDEEEDEDEEDGEDEEEDNDGDYKEGEDGDDEEEEEQDQDQEKERKKQPPASELQVERSDPTREDSAIPEDVLQIAKRLIKFIERQYNDALRKIRQILNLPNDGDAILGDIENDIKMYLEESPNVTSGINTALIYLAGLHTKHVRRNLSPYRHAHSEVKESTTKMETLQKKSWPKSLSDKKDVLSQWVGTLFLSALSTFGHGQGDEGAPYNTLNMYDSLLVPDQRTSYAQKCVFRGFISCLAFNVTKMLMYEVPDDTKYIFCIPEGSKYQRTKESNNNTGEKKVIILDSDESGSDSDGAQGDIRSAHSENSSTSDFEPTKKSVKASSSSQLSTGTKRKADDGEPLLGRNKEYTPGRTLDAKKQKVTEEVSGNFQNYHSGKSSQSSRKKSKKKKRGARKADKETKTRTYNL
mmetsp:Transcript_1994/g.4486  ORF Transcript_1994/g.4486 Transcript_1994/m.4486 type:complete len:1318 (-) Transcript_1994:21-3974(-)